MEDNYDAEAARAIIEAENVNVTEKNPLGELFKILSGLAVTLVCVYTFIFLASGVVLQTLREDKRTNLEEYLTKSHKQIPIEISAKDRKRIERVKNKILTADTDFPKTSKLEINVIKNKDLNAFCYPNGNIDITEPLFKELKTDEELTFIIAHEMGHYKHKDHLMHLRRNISNAATVILFSVFNTNSNINTVASSGFELSELSFSRQDETNADKYAINMMNKIYGNAEAGIRVMEILKEKNKFNIEFLSTHPDLDRRIENIRKMTK
ncbi:M48 family metallopeptidase [bacterium]|nr:M48 family metallopeptidase [bacterium]